MTYPCKDCGKPCGGLRCEACRAGREAEPKAEAPKGPRMNKTEAAHALRLTADPQVVGWEFEAFKVRVGLGRTWYTPDFLVRLRDGSIRLDEVKGGHIHDDARVKFKTAAMLYPWWGWRMVQRRKGAWNVVYDHPAQEPIREEAAA